jgi:hypothetical protein
MERKPLQHEQIMLAVKTWWMIEQFDRTEVDDVLPANIKLP